MGDVVMLERRFVYDPIDLVSLSFSFEFHAVLWAFDKQTFLC